MKTSTLALALILSITLTACGNTGSPEPTAATVLSQPEDPIIVVDSGAGSNDEETQTVETPVEPAQAEQPAQPAETAQAEAPAEMNVPEQEEVKNEPKEEKAKFTYFMVLKSKKCFLNKMASEAMGEKVFTRSTMKLDRSGIGMNSYRLFADENCEKEITRGQARFTWEVVNAKDGVMIFHFVQYNSQDEKDVTEYWIPAIQAERKSPSYYFDLDFRNEGAGPYDHEPDSKEVREFAEKPERGVIFKVTKLVRKH